MGVITPTFKDHVDAQHEPLSGNPVVIQPGITNVPWVTPTPVIPPKPGLRTKKLALVGTAPSSRLLAPYNDQSWTIWACSPGNMNTIPRYDAWWEIHGNLLFPENESYGKPYIEWLSKLQAPVFVLNNYYNFPTTTIVPWWDLIREEEFGEDFFTSSFSWMMAEGMRQGATEIQLFGIDMASRDEYILQRPGFYHFRREARRRGVQINAPHESDIMQSPPLYGIADAEPFGRKILAREQEVKARIGQMETQLNQQSSQLNNNITYLRGAVEDLDYFKSIWMGLGNQVASLKAENARLKLEMEASRKPAVQGVL